MRMLFSVLIISIVTVSCATVSSAKKDELKQWQAQNLAIEEKSPSVAAALNILPGVGDFYNGNVGYGVVNLLMWPLSIAWAPVGGADGALEVNYNATKHHVTNLENRKAKFKSELHLELSAGKISKDQFYYASKKIEMMELGDFSKIRSYYEFLPQDNLVIERLPSSSQR